MFTGIIQKIGRVETMTLNLPQPLLRIAHDPWDSPLTPGESIAVQGVCLTVVRAEQGWFEGNVLQETLQRTNLSAVKRGDRLNLERALRAGDRLGGHIVSGHVDGVGKVREIVAIGGDWRLTVECSSTLADGIVEKGSIAIDGVSLTVGAIQGCVFTCYLVAFTWSNTTLRNLHTGSAINLELDMLGKYARRREPVESTAGNITEEFIARAGNFGRS